MFFNERHLVITDGVVDVNELGDLTIDELQKGRMHVTDSLRVASRHFEMNRERIRILNVKLAAINDLIEFAKLANT